MAKTTVTEIIDDLLNGLNDLKNHDINGDGKVTIDDVAALIDQCLHGDEEAGDDSVFNVRSEGNSIIGRNHTKTGITNRQRQGVGAGRFSIDVNHIAAIYNAFIC